MRAAAFFCIVLAVVPAAAQEFTIFDINDFVDPRELGATVGAGGALTCPCSTLLIGRAMIGFDRDFLNVMQPTNFDVAFGHAALSAYFNGVWQVNLKQSFLQEVREPDRTDRARGAFPKGSLALQVGHYATTPSDTKRADGTPMDPDGVAIGRTMFTWRMSRYSEIRSAPSPVPGDPFPLRNDNFVEPPREVNELRHEFSYEVDVDVDDFIGTLSYTLLADPNDDSDWLHRPARLAVSYRFNPLDLGPTRVEPTFAFGWIGRGVLPGSRFTMLPAARIVLPLGRSDAKFNLRVAPMAQRHEGWKFHLEVALFVDTPFLSRTW